MRGANNTAIEVLGENCFSESFEMLAISSVNRAVELEDTIKCLRRKVFSQPTQTLSLHQQHDCKTYAHHDYHEVDNKFINSLGFSTEACLFKFDTVRMLG